MNGKKERKEKEREEKKMEYKLTNEEAAAYVELQEMLANEERKRREEDYTFGMKEAALCIGMPPILLTLMRLWAM